MTEMGGMEEEFVNVCKGFGVGLASGEGVDEREPRRWALGSGQTMSGDAGEISLLPPGRGRSGRADDGWWSEAVGAAVCCGSQTGAPGTGG